MVIGQSSSKIREKMTPVLIIDDDVELTKLLEEYLQGEQFELAAAHDGPGGLEKALNNSYSVIVLDVMLPGMSGLDVLKQLRQKSTAPVLMLTARGSELDRILGLELGADDYLAKPFNPRELVARLRAILRRTNNAPSAASPVHIADLELHPESRSVTCGGKQPWQTLERAFPSPRCWRWDSSRCVSPRAAA